MKDKTRIEFQPRGTRIFMGDEAEEHLLYCGGLWGYVMALGYRPIILPALDGEDGYEGKPGEMFRVQGPSRGTVLCPERTSQIQRWAKANRDLGAMKLAYCERCYRLERPQANRYREFTQFGVERVGDGVTRADSVAASALTHCLEAAKASPYRVNIDKFAESLQVSVGVRRGLDYYRSGETFEISCEALGAQKQIVGGGRYEEGIGYAIGVERLIAAARMFSMT